MTKTEWYQHWGKVRKEAREIAKPLFQQNPDAMTVSVPFLFPIQSTPKNCKLVIIPLGNKKYDYGYKDEGGRMIYRTHSTPWGEIIIKRANAETS